MPMVDLNIVNDVYWEEQEISKIKKMQFDEWKKREEDEKRKIKYEKESQKKEIELLKRNKELERRLVSSDYRGNLIMVKPYPTERLSSEFLVPRGIINTKDIVQDKIVEKVVDKKQAPTYIIVTEEKQDRTSQSHFRARSNLYGNKKVNIVEFNKDFQPAGSNYE
jgi:hypothetical protein